MLELLLYDTDSLSFVVLLHTCDRDSLNLSTTSWVDALFCTYMLPLKKQLCLNLLAWDDHLKPILLVFIPGTIPNHYIPVIPTPHSHAFSHAMTKLIIILPSHLPNSYPAMVQLSSSNDHG